MNRRTQLAIIALALGIVTSAMAASPIARSYPDYQAVLGGVEGFAILGNLQGCPPVDAKTERFTMAMWFKENPPLTPTEISELTASQAWAAKTPNPQKADALRFYNLRQLQTKLYNFQSRRMYPGFTLLVNPRPIQAFNPNPVGTLRAIQLEKWEAVIEMNCPFGSGMPGPCYNPVVRTITNDDCSNMAHPWDSQWRFKQLRASYRTASDPFSNSMETGTLTLEFSPYFASGTLWSDQYGKRSIVANYNQAGLIGQQTSYKRPTPPTWLPLLDNYDLGTWKGYPGLVAQSNFQFRFQDPPSPPTPPLPLINRPECGGTRK